MRSWKVRLMMLLSMVAMLLALAAPVAMADDDDDCELLKRGDRADLVECEDERFTVPAFVNQAELDDDDDDGDEFFLLGDEFGDDDFVGGAAVIEDIDCDGIADHEDWFDDQLCEVELEVFGEDVEVLVEAEDIWDEGWWDW
jgi:hypothetical protein